MSAGQALGSRVERRPLEDEGAPAEAENNNPSKISIGEISANDPKRNSTPMNMQHRPMNKRLLFMVLCTFFLLSICSYDVSYSIESNKFFLQIFNPPVNSSILCLLKNLLLNFISIDKFAIE
ncbi:MAG: hypothetical protein ABIO81_13210 [Ginsengibacter sp.]